MSSQVDPPKSRIRPLPPVLVTSSIALMSAPTQEDTHANSLPQNRLRESLLTVASITAPQTALPAYSNILDLAVVEHEVGFPSDEPNGPLIPEPPRYSYIFPPSPEIQMPANSTQVLQPLDARGDNSRCRGPSQDPDQQRPNFVQHRLYLKKSSGETWATLSFVSRVPLPDVKSQAPRFFGEDSVPGTLELELDTPISVRSLTLNVKGEMITRRYAEVSNSRNRDCVILDYSHVLYSRKVHGDPGQFGKCTRSRNRKPDGKMHGMYHFPFSFTFPTETTATSKQKGVPSATYELPPSFLEKYSGVTVKYEIGLVVGHGKLKMDSQVYTSVVYMPKVVAPPASQARQTAYEEGAILPGPRNDPGGWHAVAPVTLSGRFRDREAQVSCDLWLAKPLCYASGTVLPCYIAISGVDFELLEHLSSPKSVHVQLSRYVYFDGGGEGGLNASRRGSAREEEVNSVGTALWWRPPKSNQPEDQNVRWLEGEIHLSSNLQPSCNHPRFIIEYCVEMMAFLSDSFDTRGRDGRQHPIARQPIKIASYHQYGPIPRAFTAKNVTN